MWKIKSSEDESEREIKTETTRRQSEDDLQMMDNPAQSAWSTVRLEREEVNGRKPTGGARNKITKNLKISPKKWNTDGIVQVMERLVHIKEQEVNQELTHKFCIIRCMDAFKHWMVLYLVIKSLRWRSWKFLSNHDCFFSTLLMIKMALQSRGSVHR
jgi:hypothetical protein